MADVPGPLAAELRGELRHRLRPMVGRDPRQRDRPSTALELLYDLTYVIAFGTAAELLAHGIGDGAVGPAVGAYVFAVFAITWAWLNFTWFASAFDNDDALMRIATIVQMAGVVVLIFGLPAGFAAAEHGRSPNNLLLVLGYVVMRVPLILLWLRAARADPGERQRAVAYVALIAVAQSGWLLTAVLPLPVPATVAALILLAAAEMAAPVVLERRLGRLPWNAGHLAERFRLLTLITIGEVVAATTAAVGALVQQQGWSAAAVTVVVSGVVLAASLWWAYGLIPSRPILERWPERTFAWRYAHLPLFGAVAAVGAGLRVAAEAVEGSLTLLQVALALAIPVGLVAGTVFVTWSVLMRSHDRSHVPLFVLSVTPLIAAVVLAAAVGGPGPLDLDRAGASVAFAAVIGLVAASFIVEVVGHERVGYAHTLRAVRAAPAPTEPAASR